jgi:two-component system, OmpR family, response regulator ResD
MLVDDEERLRQLYSMVLRKNAYNVLESRNGSEAVRAIENDDSIEVVVMDYLMPEMDGLTATRIIKGINPNVKVILCSAYSDELSVEQQSLFDAILGKPISKKDLVDAVEGVLKRLVRPEIFSEGINHLEANISHPIIVEDLSN